MENGTHSQLCQDHQRDHGSLFHVRRTLGIHCFLVLFFDPREDILDLTLSSLIWYALPPVPG